MTEEEFRALQHKHRREAEEIRAGIKARKKRYGEYLLCGQAFREGLPEADYTRAELKSLAEYAAGSDAVRGLAGQLKRGR